MKMSALMQGLYKEFASAAKRIVQAADERIPLFAKTRTVHVSISVTTRNPRTISGDHWNACECVDERVAVRDENGLLIGWFCLGCDRGRRSAHVARRASPAADGGGRRSGVAASCMGFCRCARAPGELDGKPSIPGQAARRRGESHG